jgi:hypothetical protein
MPKISEGSVALTGLFALAIWLFVALPYIYGPTPSGYRNEPHSSEPAKAASTEPKGTASAPFFVQVIPAPKSAEESAQEAEDREEKKNADRWLVRWTFALFAATIGLILATGILGFFAWRQAKDMKESVAAANRSVVISERALTELEAPFTAIKVMESGLTRKYSEMGHDFGILQFAITNHGRTPARLVELVDKTHLVPRTGGLPPQINLGYRSKNTMPYGVIAPPDSESQPFSQNLLGNHMNELAADPVLLKSNAIFFYGFVRYETIFKQTYRMGFCYIFDMFSEQWLLSGDENYNYLIRED